MLPDLPWEWREMTDATQLTVSVTFDQIMSDRLRSESKERGVSLRALVQACVRKHVYDLTREDLHPGSNSASETILAYLERFGATREGQLADVVDAPPSTFRSAIESLLANGDIVKSKGGYELPSHDYE